MRLTPGGQARDLAAMNRELMNAQTVTWKVVQENWFRQLILTSKMMVL